MLLRLHNEFVFFSDVIWDIGLVDIYYHWSAADVNRLWGASIFPDYPFCLDI